jgi:vanillate O-demethylase ferredoxin subunit
MPRTRLADKIALNDRIAAFTLVPLDGPLPDWQAGAHVQLDLGAAGLRSYSLIDWPGQPRDALRIAVQREDAGTGGSVALHALPVGAEIAVTEPANSFALADAPEPVALIAGGIGVTPLISMATALQARGHPFVFHYAGRSAGVMAYADELARALGPALHLHPDDAAPFDIPATLAGLSGHRLYVCGPRPMIEATRAAAEAAGIASDRIHVELFTTAAPAAGDQPFEVQINDGRVIPVAADQSIVEALEAAGVDVIYDCQRGDCGICQTAVISGTPDHRDVVLSQAERDAGKLMQICVSRARSARLVLDI